MEIPANMEDGKQVRNVSELWLYPIKSCRGIAVDALALGDRGPRNDRAWMLVDEDNQFLTQRELPRMALIDVALTSAGVTVEAPGMTPMSFAPEDTAPAETCVVWSDVVELRPAPSATSAWFSDFLGLRCRLMHMPGSSQRVVNRQYVPEDRLVSLADGYPLLLIGEGSLALLNQKLQERGEQPVPMRRFRPNIVVAGTQPHEEDEWASIRIGDVACKVVKPCARCAITTVDVTTGVAGKEPLRTLATYRKVGSNVQFGQNVVHDYEGTLSIGDAVAATLS